MPLRCIINWRIKMKWEKKKKYDKTYQYTVVEKIWHRARDTARIILFNFTVVVFYHQNLRITRSFYDLVIHYRIHILLHNFVYHKWSFKCFFSISFFHCFSIPWNEFYFHRKTAYEQEEKNTRKFQSDFKRKLYFFW